MPATGIPVRPLLSTSVTGDGGPSGRRSKVEAVIHKAVAEDKSRPATAMRASSTCRRAANGPRNGENQRRQPPARRATSTAPETASTSMAAAAAAIAMRPPSPKRSERCSLVNQRSNGFESAEAISRPVAGSLTAARGTPFSDQ